MENQNNIIIEANEVETQETVKESKFAKAKAKCGEFKEKHGGKVKTAVKVVLGAGALGLAYVLGAKSGSKDDEVAEDETDYAETVTENDFDESYEVVDETIGV